MGVERRDKGSALFHIIVFLDHCQHLPFQTIVQNTNSF